MGLFTKKLSDEELIKQNIASQQAELEEKENANKKDEDSLGDSKLAIEVTKIKAQLEGLAEQRKATGERFTKMSEDMGEIRGMVMETNKSVSKIEASATKAIDLVESVKPEELMVEVRKQDFKIEALKANLESNEALMKDLFKEMKEMRRKIDFYKGVEQVAKMNEEIKNELIDIKKTEAVIERHSNKVESIFLDVEKKFSEFDKFNDVTKDLKRAFDKIQGDVDKVRVKIEEKSEKKEVITLLNKFNDFEKHTTNIINLLDDRSKSSVVEINSKFEEIKQSVDRKVDLTLRKINVDPNEIKKMEDQMSASSAATAASAAAPAKEGESGSKTESSEKKNIISSIKSIFVKK